MISVKNVLVAIDFDEHTETVLDYARTLTRMFGGRLHVLHVTENSFLRPTAMDPHSLQASAVNQVSQRLTDADRQNLAARAVVRISDAPADEIVDYARDEGIDLDRDGHPRAQGRCSPAARQRGRARGSGGALSGPDGA